MRLGAGMAVTLALAAPAAAGASVGNFGMAVQPDGKIVVAGGAGLAPEGGREFGAVVRYLPDGRLDRSFDGDGVVLLRQQRPFTAVALQENGRILVASPIGGRAGLTRLLPSGALDTSFGEGGYLYGGASTSFFPTSLAVGKSGRIFVGGMTGYPQDSGEHWYGWLYSVTSNGRSGGVFGGMTTGQSDQPKTFVNDFVFDPGGSVVVAGTVAERRADAKAHAALARLLPGSVEPGGTPTAPDPAFGGGLVASDIFPASPMPEAANALSRHEGGLLIAGEAGGSMLVSRYFGNGTKDNGFGRRGFWTINVGGTSAVANALAVDAKGGIFVAGSTSSRCAGGECSSLLLAHLARFGHPVKRWGHDGILTPAPAYARLPGFEVAYDLALRPQGRVLVGGLVGDPSSSRFFLRRYLADGTPDRSFGRRGRVTTLPVAVRPR